MDVGVVAASAERILDPSGNDRNYEQTFAGFAERKLEGGIREDNFRIDRPRSNTRSECAPPSSLRSVNDPNYSRRSFLSFCPMGIVLAWAGARRIAKLAAIMLSGMVIAGIS